jgi:hypothetical protein
VSEQQDQRPDIRIEGNIATWEMRAEGNISGTYAGTFRFRCFLTPTQQLAAGREYRDLLGQNLALAAPHESMLAWALSQLKQRVITSPPFWTSQGEGNIAGDIPDEEVITIILDAAIAAEEKYKAIIQKRKDDAIARAQKAGEAILEQNKAKNDEKED